LESLLGADIDHVFFVSDTKVHRLIYKLQRVLPGRLGFFTFGFLLNLLIQIAQKRMVKSLIASHSIDLVHEPIRVSPKLPSVMHGLGVPVIIGPMNGGMDYPPSFSNYENSWEKLLMPFGRLISVVVNRLFPGKKYADMLLVANERTRNALPFTKGKRIVELVENGVDLTIFGGYDSDPEAVCDRIARFIFIGRLVDWKAVDLLLHAASDLPKEGFTLDIVGDGPEKRRLMGLCSALGLDSNINFRGFLSQLECASLLEVSDCLVLPSLYECGGAVVLEAMAGGRPVIATKWGGPADYIDDSCGILIDVEGGRTQFIADLTNAMRRMIESPELRKRMGAAGRDKVIRHYDWDKKVLHMAGLYRSVLVPETS
jgi:glycosyltransferase involved in cell wall biosynthesis